MRFPAVPVIVRWRLARGRSVTLGRHIGVGVAPVVAAEHVRRIGRAASVSPQVHRPGTVGNKAANAEALRISCKLLRRMRKQATRQLTHGRLGTLPGLRP